MGTFGDDISFRMCDEAHRALELEATAFELVEQKVLATCYDYNLKLVHFYYDDEHIGSIPLSVAQHCDNKLMTAIENVILEAVERGVMAGNAMGLAGATFHPTH